jgi:hypothetical protein
MRGVVPRMRNLPVAQLASAALSKSDYAGSSPDREV